MKYSLKPLLYGTEKYYDEIFRSLDLKEYKAIHACSIDESENAFIVGLTSEEDVTIEDIDNMDYYCSDRITFTYFQDHCGTVIFSNATSKLSLEIAEIIAKNMSKGMIQYINKYTSDDDDWDQIDDLRDEWLRELNYKEIQEGRNPNTGNDFKLFVKLINQN